MTVSDSRLRHTRLLDDSALSALEVDNDCAIITNLLTYLLREFHTLPRMWADAQRDGRAAEYRWFPLFINAAMFG